MNTTPKSEKPTFEVGDLVRWRDGVKSAFIERYGPGAFQVTKMIQFADGDSKPSRQPAGSKRKRPKPTERSWMIQIIDREGKPVFASRPRYEPMVDYTPHDPFRDFAACLFVKAST